MWGHKEFPFFWYLCPGVSDPLVRRAYGYFEVRHLMGLSIFSPEAGVPVCPSSFLRLPWLKSVA